MGTPAWQVRESERKALNTQLMSVIYAKADQWDHNPTFLFAVASCLIACLSKPKKDGMLWTNCGDADDQTMYFVEIRVIQEIQKFARSRLECMACIVHLLEDVLKAATSRIIGDSQSEEIQDPKKIFSTESATQEVHFVDYSNDPGMLM